MSDVFLWVTTFLENPAWYAYIHLPGHFRRPNIQWLIRADKVLISFKALFKKRGSVFYISFYAELFTKHLPVARQKVKVAHHTTVETAIRYSHFLSFKYSTGLTTAR